MATYNTIQVIKMLRDSIPGMSLKGAKDLVDSYELKTFENRVVNALGEESRMALQNWARLFVRQEERENREKITAAPNVPDSWSQDVPNYVEGCTCSDCSPQEEYPDGLTAGYYDDNYCCSDCDGY